MGRPTGVYIIEEEYECKINQLCDTISWHQDCIQRLEAEKLSLRKGLAALLAIRNQTNTSGICLFCRGKGTTPPPLVAL